MRRDAMRKLVEWKERTNRKPMIIRGARQVGKTWLMKRFGDECYPKTVYINFDNNRVMQDLFTSDLRVDRLLTGLELYHGGKINPDDTLLIFDEIQESPKALASLKYFNEDAPQYQIICAGSLLGVAMHQGTSFPVGKVEFMDLYPLSFFEFLRAMGKEAYVDLLESGSFDLATTFRHEYITLLKHYCVIGGMPEVVAHFSQHHDFKAARNLQQQILMAYEQDFSKHAPREIVPRIRMLWNNIPTQLSKENKKFIYGLVREGSRAKDYELALLWLTDCGLVHQVHQVSVPRIPLQANVNMKAFKLYLLDVGLLSCMTRLDPSVLLEGNQLFMELKGALTEQVVLQQLVTMESLKTCYWTNDRGSAEVNFLVDDGRLIVPVEVKAETNLKAKSLKIYHEKYAPQISVRTAMTDYKWEDWLLNLPLWAVGILDWEMSKRNGTSFEERISGHP